MLITIPYTEVNDWVDINTLIGIDAGTELYIQNRSSASILAVCSDDSDSVSDNDGYFINERGGREDTFSVSYGAPTLYVKLANKLPHNNIVLNIIETTYTADIINRTLSIPNDIYTSSIANVRRLSVDSQQTSFEENTQFRYVDEYSSVVNDSDIIYLVTTTAPINLFERTLSLYEGGRSYKVYLYTDGEDTITGDSDTEQRSITPMNYLLRDGLTTHPTSNMTITRYTGATFTPSTDNDWLDVTNVLTDGNANRATDSFNSDNLRFGSGDASSDSPLSFVLVLTGIGSSSSVTNGFLRLVWEERV